jgi:hypothetical protein
MAQVTAIALGGQPTPVTDVNTVADVAKKLNLGESLQVKVNDEPADYSYELSDYEWVTFGEKVKGGLQ